MITKTLKEAVAEAQRISEMEMPTQTMKDKRERAIACKGDKESHPYYQCAIAFKTSGKTVDEFMSATGLPEREAYFLFDVRSKSSKGGTASYEEKIEALLAAIMDAEELIRKAQDGTTGDEERDTAIRTEAAKYPKAHPYYKLVKLCFESGVPVRDMGDVLTEQPKAVATLYKLFVTHEETPIPEQTAPSDVFTKYPSLKSVSMEKQVVFADRVMSGNLKHSSAKRQYCIEQAIATKGRRYFGHHPYARLFRHLSSAKSCADIHKYFSNMAKEDFLYFVKTTYGPTDYEALSDEVTEQSAIPAVEIAETMDFPYSGEIDIKAEEAQSIADEVEREIIAPVNEDVPAEDVSKAEPEQEKAASTEGVQDTTPTEEQDNPAVTGCISKIFCEALSELIQTPMAQITAPGNLRKCHDVFELAQLLEYMRLAPEDYGFHAYEKIIETFDSAGYTPAEIAWLFPITPKIIQSHLNVKDWRAPSNINRLFRPGALPAKVHSTVWGVGLVIAGVFTALGTLIGAYCY